MSVSLIVSGAGAVVAAIGLVMLLARCSRTPRGDLIAWAVALLGLLCSLGAQAAGHVLGFNAIIFRVTELGASVIAPMALIMGLSEAVARSTAGRFAGRLLIPAFTIIPLVIFGTDPLTSTAFTKAWPPPATYYQLIPNKLLEYGLAPVTVIVALVTAGIAIRRSGRELAWRAALVPVLAAAVAVLVLALPGVAPVFRDHLGIRLPLPSLFAVLCVVAAGLTWYAGTGAASVPIDALRDGSLRTDNDRGRPARPPARAAAGPGPYERYDRDGYEQGAYEGGGYGRGPYDDAYRRGGDSSGYDTAAYDNAAHDSAMYDGGSAGDPGPRRSGIDQTGDLEAYRDGARYRDELSGPGPGREPDPDAGPRTGDVAVPADPAVRAGPPAAQPAGPGDGLAPVPAAAVGQRGDHPDDQRDELFGQIAIYTLIEDQVAAFDRLTQRIVGEVRSREPSTLVYIVHAVPSAPMQRILYEVYRDRDAYERHQQQPYVTQFEEDHRPYVLATNVIELGLQHAKVSPFPSITDLFGEPGYDTSGFERPDFTREYGSTATGPGGLAGR